MARLLYEETSFTVVRESPAQPLGRRRFMHTAQQSTFTGFAAYSNQQPLATSCGCYGTA